MDADAVSAAERGSVLADGRGHGSARVLTKRTFEKRLCCSRGS